MQIRGQNICRVDVLPELQCTHCDSDYDVTIATYSLPDLYLPEMKIAFFVAPESNKLPFACSV